MEENSEVITEEVPQEAVIAKFSDDNPVNEREEDVVIKEKDTHIAEKPPIEKADEPEKTPTATPKDIPARTEKEQKDTEPKDEVKLNATSQKVFDLLKEGKIDDVVSILSEKQKYANADKLSPAEAIKLQIQLENKEYSPEEVNDIFEEKFAKPEPPEQKLDETDDEFETREQKYKEAVAKIDRRIEREAKSATAELKKRSEEIVLPDITPPTQQPQEQSQEDLAKLQSVREDYLKSISDGLDSLEGITATYKDEDVEIPAKYIPNKEEKTHLKKLMEDFDINNYFGSRWLDKDGKLDAKKVGADLFRLEFGDKAVSEIANKVGSKRYAETIKQQSNVDYSGKQRTGSLAQNPEQVKTDMGSFFFRQ